MALKKKIKDLDSYGSSDLEKCLKDEFEVSKNEGTYGTPDYPIGSSRKLTLEELKRNLQLNFTTETKTADFTAYPNKFYFSNAVSGNITITPISISSVNDGDRFIFLSQGSNSSIVPSGMGANDSVTAISGEVVEYYADKISNRWNKIRHEKVTETLLSELGIDSLPTTSYVDDGDAYILSTSQSYTDARIKGAEIGQGNFDASTGAYPTSSNVQFPTAGAAIKAGYEWRISVAGTPSGYSRELSVGDFFRALVDSPGTTPSNWADIESNLGYVAENTSNKTDIVTGNETSITKYLSVKGVYDWAVSLFVQKNTSITGATKTKITYDAKGLVTAGADANTDDIQESGTPTNKWWTNARTIASTLTGFVSGAGTVSASDTILQAIQKIVGNSANYVDKTTLQDISGRKNFTGTIASGNNAYFTDGFKTGAIYTSGSDDKIIIPRTNCVIFGQYANPNAVGITSVAIGDNSMGQATGGQAHTCVGSYSGWNLQSGSLANVFIGRNAGSNITTGSYNVNIGLQGYSASNESNRLRIDSGATWRSFSMIYGEFDNQLLAFNARLGVGAQTVSSDSQFDVVATTKGARPLPQYTYSGLSGISSPSNGLKASVVESTPLAGTYTYHTPLSSWLHSSYQLTQYDNTYDIQIGTGAQTPVANTMYGVYKKVKHDIIVTKLGCFVHASSGSDTFYIDIYLKSSGARVTGGTLTPSNATTFNYCTVSAALLTANTEYYCTIRSTGTSAQFSQRGGLGTIQTILSWAYPSVTGASPSTLPTLVAGTHNSTVQPYVEFLTA